MGFGTTHEHPFFASVFLNKPCAFCVGRLRGDDGGDHHKLKFNKGSSKV